MGVKISSDDLAHKERVLEIPGLKAKAYQAHRSQLTTTKYKDGTHLENEFLAQRVTQAHVLLCRYLTWRPASTQELLADARCMTLESYQTFIARLDP